MQRMPTVLAYVVQLLRLTRLSVSWKSLRRPVDRKTKTEQDVPGENVPLSLQIGAQNVGGMST